MAELQTDDQRLPSLLPRPWEFRPEGNNGGPGIFTASGDLVAGLYWPCHPAEQTEQCEREVYEAGRLMASAFDMAMEIRSLKREIEELQASNDRLAETAMARVNQRGL